MTSPPARVVEPLSAPPDVSLSVPGSKSITNRALACAALAHGRSVLGNVGFGDDVEAMLDGLARLGVDLGVDRQQYEVDVEGTGGTFPVTRAELDVRQSGTTGRFLSSIVAAGNAEVRVDGHPQLRDRPMRPLVDALRQLGATVRCEGVDGALPYTVLPTDRPGRHRVTLSGDVSSQFLSGLLLSGPLHPEGLEISLTTELVSRPYVDLTVAVMRDFGVEVDEVDPGHLAVAPGARYRGRDLRIEPDASSASYLFAAAAVTGGRVRIEGLGRGSTQGDVAFVDVLEQMGAAVDRTDAAIEVTGPRELVGVDADFSMISDTAPTIAATAPFASSPTRIRGVGFIRRKESDRVGNVVTELRRLGIDAVEEPDGFLVRPGIPRPGRVETYDDHRIAMAFAVIGLRVPGIEIADPACVAKTFPTYWDVLDRLRG